MSTTTEKIKPTEARRTLALSRPKRPDPRDADAAGENETLWQQFDWRELNLVSSARPLRHWHD